MSETERAIVSAAEVWLTARQKAIRLLASGEPASQAVSDLGAAEHALANAVRAHQKDQS